MDPVLTAVEFWLEPLRFAAFFLGWTIGCVTTIMFAQFAR